MEQIKQVKTSAKLYKIPEVSYVSLMPNDTDSAVCSGPLEGSPCPVCSDVAEWKAAIDRFWENKPVYVSGDQVNILLRT